MKRLHHMNRSWTDLRLSTRLITTFVAVYLGALIGVIWGHSTPYTAPVWMVSAIALAAIVSDKPKYLPHYLIVVYVADYLGSITFVGDTADAITYLLRGILWVGADILEIVIAYLMFRHFIGVGRDLNNLRTALLMMFVVAIVPPVLVALPAAGLLISQTPGADDYWQAVRTWYLSDAVALAVLFPCLLRLQSADMFLGIRREHRAECMLFMVSIFVVAQLAFYLTASPFLFLLGPLLIWPAIRMGPFETLLGGLIILFSGVTYSVLEFGPFALAANELRLFGFEFLQIFMFVSIVPPYLVAVANGERNTALSKRAAALSALGESERRFQTFFESSRDGVVIAAVDGIIEEANHAFLDLSGRSLDEISGKTLPNLTCPADSLRVAEIISEVGVEKDSSDLYEFLLENEQSEPTPVTAITWLSRNQQNKPTQMYTVVRDVAKFRQVQNRVHHQASVINALSEAVITARVSHDGIIDSWNGGAERLFGYTADEAIGKDHSMLMADINDPLSMEDVLPILEKKGEFNVERPMRRKSGNEFAGFLSLSLLRNALGEPEYVVALVNDITDVKQAEMALRESEGRLARGADLAGLSYWTASYPDWRFEFISGNFIKLLGFKTSKAFMKFCPSADEFIEEFVHPEDRELIRDRQKMAGTGKSGGVLHFRVVRPDGAIHHLRGNIAVIQNEKEEIAGIEGSILDVTAQMTAEAALRQTQKTEALGQLTGGIAHDFNNLLTIIIGNLKALGRGFETRFGSKIKESILERHAVQLEDALSASNDAADLVERLLAFSRSQVLAPSRCNINELITDFSKILRRALGGNIEIELCVASEDLFVRIDRVQLESAILNLAINARHAMSGRGILQLAVGTVVLRTTNSKRQNDLPSGKYVSIQVRDTGCGIPDAILPRITEPFFTTCNTGKGHGLGLSMVQGFLRQSGGDLRIESEIGVGTTVTLYLRIDDESEATDGQVVMHPHVSPVSDSDDVDDYRPTKDHSILIVEDEERIRRYLEDWLKQLGYNTVGAGNAEEALKILANGQRFDLIISDIIMTGELNGWDLSQIIRKESPEIKIILITGYGGPIEKSIDKEDKNIKLLKKPFDSLTIARAVSEYLT